MGGGGEEKFEIWRFGSLSEVTVKILSLGYEGTRSGTNLPTFRKNILQGRKNLRRRKYSKCATPKLLEPDEVVR
jgi:hypothetical protein